VTPRPRRAGYAADIAALSILKVGICAWVLAHGFSHVSDDDYARTVIAEQFAHAPRLDPSGTSWLPLPFWLEGTAMAALGRSLQVARAVAITSAALSVAAPYAALRAAGASRGASLTATALASALPWSAWLGASTVPESWVGALVAAAVVGMASDRARPWCAVALLAASLARYEAWPAAAAFAGFCAMQAGPSGHPRRELGWAAVALAGVLGWMAWNAHAHGSPLHFVARVRSFRHAIGAADLPLSDKILGYPRALVAETPEVALLGALGVTGLVVDEGLRVRWRWALGAAALVLAFLVVGDVRDGAPTHHPARALSPLWWVLVGCGVDAAATLYARAAWSRRRWPRAAATGAAALLGFCWCASLPGRWADSPGESESERRDAQIARGSDLRARDVAAAEVTPCAFEHFALLASWGRPERATVRERLGTPPTRECPLVVER
jgi:hypothetical protein